MYPVKWRGETYQLSDLTIGIKKAFVKWVKAHLTSEGIDNLGSRPDVLSTYLASVYAQVWWADGGMSKLTHDALASPEGGRQLNRLLLGTSGQRLSDDDLDAFMDEKEADPASDYNVAMKMIREQADPKAKGPASGPARTDGPNSTATTATTPSA